LRSPGPLPPPSKDFHRIALPIVTVGARWFRTHEVEYSPIHYGTRAVWRFDDPEGRYGVLYLAQQPAGAFIESFGQLVTTAEFPRRITSQELSRKALCELAPSRPVRLVDLTGNGLARVGADARIFAGDRQDAQVWSKAIHDHPSNVDGLLYPMRHDPKQLAAAIFDRGMTWTELSRSTWLSLGLILRDILNAYGFALIGTQFVQKPLRKGPTQSELF
jgi:hypothetical protein